MTTRDRGSVFLLTDYGGADEFAGVVRAVVARHAPGVPLIDLTHDVPPFDVRAGALALERATPHLGPGVVLAVVDPDVGSTRRAVAIESASTTGPSHFVGPDNGLLAWALDTAGGVRAAVALPSAPDSASHTFDGRDLFAPVAARLWAGARLDDIGPAIETDGLVRLDRPRVEVGAGVVEAEAQWIDRFGNVQLAARPVDASLAGLGDRLEVVAGATTRTGQLVATFADLAEGALGIVADANGHLALALPQQSAATVLAVRVGDLVTIRAPR